VSGTDASSTAIQLMHRLLDLSNEVNMFADRVAWSSVSACAGKMYAHTHAH